MKKVGPIGFAAVLVLAASFAAADRASAACDPKTSANTPVNNTTVTCTGPTDNANDPNGYGTGKETGITVNVQSGASVTGTANGLRFKSGTVNNFGTIS